MQEEYIKKRQMLSSLVLNPPYSIDGFTTAPKISKVLSFPLGVKVNSGTLFKSVFNLVFSLSIFMMVACVFVFSFYLPIQNQNTKLVSTAKSIANKKLSLLADLQEASSCNKLFSSASSFSFVDPQEIIHINASSRSVEQARKPITFSKYPSIQFSGF